MCRDELTCVSQKGIDLCVDETSDVFNMIWLVGFEEKREFRAMHIKSVMAEIVRIACGNDSIESEPPGIAVIGMKSVPLPRVVGEHDVRLGGPDPIRDLISHMERWLQLAIDMAKHYDFAFGPKAPRCFHLFGSSLFHKCLGIAIGVPGSF
jgi:hypothetical protein